MSLSELFDLLMDGAGNNDGVGGFGLLVDAVSDKAVLLPLKKLVSIFTGELDKNDRDFSRFLDKFSPRRIFV